MRQKIISFSERFPINNDEWERLIQQNPVVKEALVRDRIEHLQGHPLSLLTRNTEKKVNHKEYLRGYIILTKLAEDIDKSGNDEELQTIILSDFLSLLSLSWVDPGIDPLLNKQLNNGQNRNNWIFINHFYIGTISLFLKFIMSAKLTQENIQNAKQIYIRILSKSLYETIFMAPCYNSKINKILSVNFIYMPKSVSKIILNKIERINSNIQKPDYQQSYQQLADIRFIRGVLKNFYEMKAYFRSQGKQDEKRMKYWEAIKSDTNDEQISTDNPEILKKYIKEQEKMMGLVKYLFNSNGISKTGSR